MKKEKPNYLFEASMFKGTLTGTLKAILLWENLTEKQKSMLKVILEQNEKIEIVKR